MALLAGGGLWVALASSVARAAHDADLAVQQRTRDAEANALRAEAEALRVRDADLRTDADSPDR